MINLLGDEFYQSKVHVCEFKNNNNNNFIQNYLILYVIWYMVNNRTHMGLICLVQYEKLPEKLLFER